MADSIHVKLPDGSVKDVPKGTTALDIAKSIGQRLADATLVAKTNGDLIDVTRPLEKDTDLRLLTDRDPPPPCAQGLPPFLRAFARRGCAVTISLDQAGPRAAD